MYGTVAFISISMNIALHLSLTGFQDSPYRQTYQRRWPWACCLPGTCSDQTKIEVICRVWKRTEHIPAAWHRGENKHSNKAYTLFSTRTEFGWEVWVCSRVFVYAHPRAHSAVRLNAGEVSIASSQLRNSTNNVPYKTVVPVSKIIWVEGGITLTESLTWLEVMSNPQTR